MSDHTAQSRRRFLQTTLAGGAALGLSRASLSADGGKPGPGKIGDYKISLVESKGGLIMDHGKDTFQRNLDFPRIARERYGVEGVEFNSEFFPGADAPTHLRDLKQRAADQGVTCVLIRVEYHGYLNKLLETHKPWVDAAAALGCHAIGIDTSLCEYSASDARQAADVCRKLTEYGAQNKISILCENIGGESMDPDSLLALMRAVDHERFGTLPNFGGFPFDLYNYAVNVYDAIARMMPYAKGVAAFVNDRNLQPPELERMLKYAKGNGPALPLPRYHSELEYPRLLKIVTDAGYHSWVGIAYKRESFGEGSFSEVAGNMFTKRMLEALRGSDYKPPGR